MANAYAEPSLCKRVEQPPIRGWQSELIFMVIAKTEHQ
ncbi:hypothetical protein R615_00585 [Thalassolituus oleivorans R6-15]|jgi:hypothetical protein|uniref:Uncharacterized protein n=1 Tax=hydrothermal vent metagenome TaxID=652676 RepID=A0A160TET3_9ZZZZ|nr:hypothetical protein R615_00585 [Thalassolituus oleivorans R6-15]